MNVAEMKIEKEYHALVLFELDLSVDLREAQLRRELDSDEGNIDYHDREVQILQGKLDLVNQRLLSWNRKNSE